MNCARAVVSIDSQVLGWYVQDPSKNSDGRIRRARWLIDDLAREKVQILLPSLALSEFLHPVDEIDRRAIWATVAEVLHIAPHDAHAAEIGAKLAVLALARPRSEPGDRQVAKADAQIVASAKAAGATVFYSDDQSCRALAEAAGMEARVLPDIPPNLFDGDK
jgi:predicted nucleic acid-binding protein